MATLINAPPNLGSMRQQLFDLTASVTLTSAEFEVYWPYIDNVYSLKTTRVLVKEGRAVSRIYECRFRRPTHISRALADQNASKRTKREGETCQMRVRSIYKGGIYTISRMEADTGHTHPLAQSDATKRNSALRNVAAIEGSKGYSPATVTNALRGMGREEGRIALEEAGGRYIYIWPAWLFKLYLLI